MLKTLKQTSPEEYWSESHLEFLRRGAIWMVITWKKNGEPRRKVDLAALSKAGIRKTHHTRSPFNVVRSIPSETQKTTLACKYGYHGVPLAEEDRQKTTFITEQGRFRYARATQGYGSSNDGYTQRTDKILRNCDEGMRD